MELGSKLGAWINSKLASSAHVDKGRTSSAESRSANEAASVPFLLEPTRRRVQETLLQHGISPKVARSKAEAELWSWSPDDISNVLAKVRGIQPDMKTFPTPLELERDGESRSWVKAPAGLLKTSAELGCALCINAKGDWELRTEGYVAISHVWEEGIQADPNNRGMPLALIRRITDKLKQTGAEWIWLDGLAIPAGNRALTAAEETIKIDIINSLAAIYERADAVVILDALVMRLQSDDSIDCAVALVCGKWVTRLWTYQEIKLAKKASIITGTGVVDYEDMFTVLRSLAGDNEGLSLGDQLVARMMQVPVDRRKYDKLYGTLARLSHFIQPVPSLMSIALCCYDRRTGNDIDYARAFFPVLGLKWRAGMTREEGMSELYAQWGHYAKYLVLMHGSPRLSRQPGWAPSYLTGLEGDPILDEDYPVEWTRRGIKRTWLTYKVAWRHESSAQDGIVLELENRHGEEPVLCGCLLSQTERPSAVEGFSAAVRNGTAYLLTNETLAFPRADRFAFNAILIERDDQTYDAHEAWVYLTVAVNCMGRHQQSLEALHVTWLLRHENPISNYDQSGKDGSRLFDQIVDDDSFHKGQTPAHVAAMQDNAEALRRCISVGKYVEIPDSVGWRPLHAAASAGQVRNVEMLLKHNAQVDAEDGVGKTPLVVAAINNQTQAAKALLAGGAKVDPEDTDVTSALVEAVTRHFYETAMVLLEAGADPNRVDSVTNMTPLFFASNNLAMTDLLIQVGADVSLRHGSGSSLLHYAARHGNSDVIERLLQERMPVDISESVDANPGQTPLYYAILEQKENAVATLLSHKADVNKTFDRGLTPLTTAAEVGNPRIMQLLLDSGAHVRPPGARACEPEGWTALHLAAKEGHRVVAKLLVEHGADVSARDAEGCTPLDLAMRGGHSSIAAALRESGQRANMGTRSERVG